jgi:hypothetical protein
MKLTLKNLENYFSQKEKDAILSFFRFLQDHLPLNKDVSVLFMNKRNGEMTTGVRLPQHNIHVLAKDRLLIDVLRTISHEWVHEFQHQKLGLKDTKKIQDIGGPEENMANVLSGIFLKKFVKDQPHHKHAVYGELD